MRPRARLLETPPALEISRLRLRRDGRLLDFLVRPGEVVAVTGPLGAGKSRLLLTLFGVHPIVAGKVTLDGRAWRPKNPAEAIARGVHMAGEDRRRTAFTPADWPGGTVSASIALPHLRRWFPPGRWQAAPPRLLLLDEPFQGVDVGARADIAAAVRAQADVATLIATSDPEEALEVADRIFHLDDHSFGPFAQGAS